VTVGLFRRCGGNPGRTAKGKAEMVWNAAFELFKQDVRSELPRIALTMVAQATR
jgi:hypothetical protein